MNHPVFKVYALNRIHENWDDDGARFSVELHAEVEEGGQAGGEAFRVVLTSPATLADELRRTRSLEAGRGYLFMDDFDEPAVLA